MAFNDVDLLIMRATQAGLPLVAEPYHLLAEQLNLPVDVIMARLQECNKMALFVELVRYPIITV